MSLRVAIVTESFLPALNGVTNSVLRVLDTLEADGHEAMVISPSFRERHYGNVECFRAPAIPFKQFAVGLPNPYLTATLAQFRPDVVHVASPFWLGGQAIAAAARLRVPSVAVYQTDVSGYLARYNMQFARAAVDRMIAAIHAPASVNLAPTPAAASYLKGLGLKNVDVWGRGVDLESFHPDRRRSAEAVSWRQNIAGNKHVVGFVGRLAAEKQVHQLQGLLDLPNTHFVIVGDGPERAHLEARFAGKPVTFLGSLRGEELANAYAMLDVFVHFGTEETFGQTIQEAQATGLPVVAPASGGPIFLIESGVNGYLAQPNNLESFREKVSQLLSSDLLRARMGEDGRRSVRLKSWTSNNKVLTDHYYRLVGLPAPEALREPQSA
jgi:phosphatidylinositol alpha 1,6-mannosyltransferase